MKLKTIRRQAIGLLGASSGIGRLAALEFARRGARIVGAARDTEGLESLVREIQSMGGRAISVTADVTDYAQVEAVARTAIDHYGRLDTWVHLAGVQFLSRFEDMTPEEFSRVIDVNLLGQAYGAMVALPYLRRQLQAAYISVTSVEALAALPLQSVYAASKHGVHGFLTSLRQELQEARIPVSVTEIMPSSTNTPLFEAARTREGVQAKGQPPLYEPEVTVRAILYAAEHPVRTLVTGGGGRFLIAMKALAPRVADWYLRRMAFAGQRTETLKDSSAPSNLYEPLSGTARIRGRGGGSAYSHSIYTTLATSRYVRPALNLALAGAGLLALRALFGKQRRKKETPGR